jgi:hypothetical protein
MSTDKKVAAAKAIAAARVGVSLGEGSFINGVGHSSFIRTADA